MFAGLCNDNHPCNLLDDPAKPELVGNHKGVHIVVLWQIGIGFLEFADLLGVEHMDFPGVPAQLPVLSERVEQAVPIDGRGFHADHHALQPLGLNRRHNLLCQQFRTTEVILHPEAFDLSPSGFIRYTALL